jgi:hypothetical protein
LGRGLGTEEKEDQTLGNAWNVDLQPRKRIGRMGGGGGRGAEAIWGRERDKKVWCGKD